jgi:carbon storage regulator
MLVLSRREKESIVIGDRITVTIVEIRGKQVRLAIDAPEEIRVLRSELVDAPAARIAAA